MTSINIPKYDNEGKKSGSIEIKTSYKDLKFNPDLVHQVVLGYMSNQRQVLAHTKTRGEVRGGGKKPWRQKGTGRARIGSIRAPHWIGGGITFGPRKNRNFKTTLPKKMRRKALAVTLAKKNDEQELFGIDFPKLTEIKTKKAVLWLEKYPLKEGNILFLSDKINPIFHLSMRNLVYIKSKPVKDLNCLDLLQFNNIVFDKHAEQQISNILFRNKTLLPIKDTMKIPKSRVIKNNNIKTKKYTQELNSK